MVSTNPKNMLSKDLANIIQDDYQADRFKMPVPRYDDGSFFSVFSTENHVDFSTFIK